MCGSKTLLADRGTLLAAPRPFEKQDRPEVSAFGSGELSRAILATIRKAGVPVSAPDIAKAMAAGRTLDKREFDGLLARVRNGSTRLSDRLEGEFRDRTTYWRVRA